VGDEPRRPVELLIRRLVHAPEGALGQLRQRRPPLTGTSQRQTNRRTRSV
jgi:hypothetical protein